MQTASIETLLGSGRKLGIQSLFVLAFLGFAFGHFSTSNTESRRAKVTTEGTVLEVSQAKPSRSGKRRLRVKFEYYTPDGSRYVRRRRVRTERNVSIGQRITIRYGKRRPKYGRVLSLSPPPPKVVKSRPPGRRNFPILQILLGMATIPALGFGIYLFLKGRVASQRTSRNEHHSDEQPEKQYERSKAAREYRTHPSTASIPPKHKSKVVQRAGWF